MTHVEETSTWYNTKKAFCFFEVFQHTWQTQFIYLLARKLWQSKNSPTQLMKHYELFFTKNNIRWCQPIYFLTLYHNLLFVIILTPISCHVFLFSLLMSSILSHFLSLFSGNVFHTQKFSFQTLYTAEKRLKSVCLWPMVRLGASHLPVSNVQTSNKWFLFDLIRITIFFNCACFTK